MSNSNRPLSPHLQVYKPQLTSVLSILHRGTGMVITLGALVIAAWIWGAMLGPSGYDCISGLLNSVVGTLVMIVWTWCICYHLLNGIRHLFWDYGWGFELNQAYFSGKLVVAGSVVLTVLVWLI